jgi:predicted metalloprotease with PDZ domain
VPYGRGFFFLASIDARIRRGTGGAHSIDDVVLQLNRIEDAGNADFIRLVNGLLGEDISEEFNKMTEGGELIPDKDSFGGYFDGVLTYDENGAAEGASRFWEWSIRKATGETYEV